MALSEAQIQRLAIQVAAWRLEEVRIDFHSIWASLFTRPVPVPQEYVTISAQSPPSTNILNQYPSTPAMCVFTSDLSL